MSNKKFEIFDIIWLNVGGDIHFIMVAKKIMYCMGVKSMASGLKFFTPKAIHFTPCQNILLFETVIKRKAISIFNLIDT